MKKSHEALLEYARNTSPQILFLTLCLVLISTIHQGDDIVSSVNKGFWIVLLLVTTISLWVASVRVFRARIFADENDRYDRRGKFRHRKKGLNYTRQLGNRKRHLSERLTFALAVQVVPTIVLVSAFVGATKIVEDVLR